MALSAPSLGSSKQVSRLYQVAKMLTHPLIEASAGFSFAPVAGEIGN
jgi:hypothetical protein